MRPVLARAGIGATNAIRAGVCAAVFVVIGLFTGDLFLLPTLSPRLYAVLFATAMCAMVIGDGAYFLASKRIGIVRAFPIGMSYPLITTLGAVAIFGEIASWSLWVGAVLIVGGTTLLGMPRQDKASSGLPAGMRDQVVGVGLAVLAAIAWGAAVFGLKEALQETNIVTANIVRLFFVSISCTFLASYLSLFQGAWPQGRWRYLAILAGLTNVGTSVFMLLAIGYAGAARASLLNGTAPFFAAPAARILFKEPLTKRTIAGILVTVAGIILVVGK